MDENRPKDRLHMREQEPLVRARNFMEVPYGYTPEEAMHEASRCLNCLKPTCRTGCPVSVDIPSFIKLVKEGRFVEAAWKIKEENAMPAVCGRVCPQEIQCESMCILGKKGEPVAIGNLERFVADYERDTEGVQVPERPSSTGRKVAIIGSGPGGLSCAADLIKSGHQVTLFEALHKPGGVLIYGIPEFRLPKVIVEKEVDYIRNLGVEVRVNAVIGNLFTIDELLNEQGYDACFIAIGAGLPTFMGIAGENLNG
ncbi:MAG TPA: NAD(P)-binding protein, partial [Thermodesulfovibrionales bacterium]|nr:NAD(P)-binding protein [Thermodesulfovibrionales bacterium]